MRKKLTVLNGKNCHSCGKPLTRPFENLFIHCFTCGLKRLEELTPSFEPCPACVKEVKNDE
jgi:DNA-directed RNA polymerase subunit RPC12/RpoP